MNKKIKGLLILLVLTIVVSAISIFVDRAPIGPCDTVVGLSTINGAFHNKFPDSGVMYFISQAFGYMALLVCVGFAGIGVLQLITKKSLWKVDRNIIALGILYAVTIVLYVLFDKIPFNYRPILEAGQSFPEPSFPSSHTMLAIVVYCSAPPVLRRYFKDKGTRLALYIAFYFLAAVTVVSRAFSGVHWLTDIICGLLISLTLLQAFFVLADWLRPLKKRQKER